ncbi:MAG: T9SS type A sorting domain-containing protein [Bacteroidota bacterium]
MKNYIVKPLLIIALLLSGNILQAQIFNYDYFLNKLTTSTQSSLVVCDDASTLSIHNVQEQNPLTDPFVFDVLVNKVDPTGNIVFTKEYRSNPRFNEKVNAAAKTADGGFILVGTQRHPSFGNNGLLIYKIKSNGNIQWAKWVGNPEARSTAEAFQIVNVDQETFLIVGTTDVSQTLVALLIKENGALIWSRKYPMLSSSLRTTRVVTDLIEDQRLDGYIIAGTEYNGTVSNFSTSNIFTFAIDLNGNITRDYMLYGNANFNTSNPDLAPAFEEGEMVMTYGARRILSSSASGPNSFTAVMKLDSRLEPLWNRFYAGANTFNNRGHSIYRNDDMNRYNIGGLYQGRGTSDLAAFNNPAFLAIFPDGRSDYLIRYKTNQEQVSTYMAQDEVNGGYFIKSDNKSFFNSFSLGLIRTTMSGRSFCDRGELVEDKIIETKFRSMIAGNTAFNGSFDTRLEVVDIFLFGAPCFFENGGGEGINDVDSPVEDSPASAALTVDAVQVFPTLLGNGKEELNVVLQLETAQQIRIEVMDAVGKKVIQKVQNMAADYDQIALDASNWSTGLHLVVIRSDDQLLGTYKVIKK